MKSALFVGMVLGLVLVSPFAQADDTYSGQAVKETAKAGTLGSAAASHASAGAANALISTGQVTSAVAAIPLSAGAAVTMSAGAAMAGGAAALGKAAMAKPGAPLPVSNESVTSMTPDQALRKPAQPAPAAAGQ
jgi:hypothetical protein